MVSIRHILFPSVLLACTVATASGAPVGLKANTQSVDCIGCSGDISFAASLTAIGATADAKRNLPCIGCGGGRRMEIVATSTDASSTLPSPNNCIGCAGGVATSTTSSSTPTNTAEDATTTVSNEPLSAIPLCQGCGGR